MSKSVYLIEKCEALVNVLKFMKGHPIQFLAQIDFWDWEIENLMFSFSNFEDRSKAWGNREEVFERLQELGLKLSREADWYLQWRPIQDRSDQVVVPDDKLCEVIALWNELLHYCEKEFLGDNLKPKFREQMGYVSALSKYEKELKK